MNEAEIGIWGGGPYVSFGAHIYSFEDGEWIKQEKKVEWCLTDRGWEMRWLNEL